MKLNKAVRPVIAATSEKSLGERATQVLSATPYYELLRVIAQMMDHVAKGGTGYIVLGTVTDRTAMSITLHWDDGKESRYADTLTELAARAGEWL